MLLIGPCPIGRDPLADPFHRVVAGKLGRQIRIRPALVAVNPDRHVPRAGDLLRGRRRGRVVGRGVGLGCAQVVPERHVDELATAAQEVREVRVVAHDAGLEDRRFLLRLLQHVGQEDVGHDYVTQSSNRHFKLPFFAKARAPGAAVV